MRNQNPEKVPRRSTYSCEHCQQWRARHRSRRQRHEMTKDSLCANPRDIITDHTLSWFSFPSPTCWACGAILTNQRTGHGRPLMSTQPTSDFDSFRSLQIAPDKLDSGILASDFVRKFTRFFQMFFRGIPLPASSTSTITSEKGVCTRGPFKSTDFTPNTNRIHRAFVFPNNTDFRIP